MKIHKNFNEESDKAYFLKFDFQHPETLHELYNDLAFLPDKIKIEKVGKLVTNLYDKIESVIYITNLSKH